MRLVLLGGSGFHAPFDRSRSTRGYSRSAHRKCPMNSRSVQRTIPRFQKWFHWVVFDRVPSRYPWSPATDDATSPAGTLLRKRRPRWPLTGRRTPSASSAADMLRLTGPIRPVPLWDRGLSELEVAIRADLQIEGMQPHSSPPAGSSADDSPVEQAGHHYPSGASERTRAPCASRRFEAMHPPSGRSLPVPSSSVARPRVAVDRRPLGA